MRIALIRRSCITYLDGVNRFVALLAEGLSKLGHESLILSWYYKGVEKERLEEWFKEMHGLDHVIPICTLRSKHFEQGSLMRMAWDWWTRGSKLLRKECMDAVIVNGIIPLRFKPKIAVIHDLGPALTLTKFHAKVGSCLLKGYDKCVAVSDKTKRELLLFSRASCEVIPIPMKLRLFKPAELGGREDLIVHIGTRPVKNPQISVEAVRILKRRYNVRLAVVGTPAEHPEGEEVEWRQGIPEKEKLELLSKAKALILPSSYEGFSYACLEAMASGTPVVVSSAVPEDVILSAEGGWLESLPGGAFGEALPHPIYLLQSLVGRLELLSTSSAKISKSKWQRHDELHALLRGERGLGRVIISYNAKHFDIYVIAEGSSGFMLVNPLGKVVAKLSSSWRYWRNLLSSRHYVMLWLDYLLGRVPRDSFRENVRVFKEHVQEGSPYVFDYDDLLNQVKVYE